MKLLIFTFFEVNYNFCNSQSNNWQKRSTSKPPKWYGMFYH